jgi:diguanylate cyclase (GGDEF)-like protein
MKTITTFLHDVELFSLLTDEEIGRITKSLHKLEVDAGHTLFKEGDEGSELFIVMTGKVASYVVLKNGNKRDIAEFTPGDFFGEMSIFENTERSATCHTKEKTTLLSLRERDLFELILYSPELAVKIMYKMLNITTERLLDRNEFLSDMVQWGEEARKRAITDELTDIYNRRFFDDALEDFFMTAKNSGRPLTLVMIDIDNFGPFSDNYKQNQINSIIIEIVETFKKILRKKDIISRYGGDEFTVIMPDTNIETASKFASSICRAVRDIPLPEIFDNNIPQITVSMGLASFPQNAGDIITLKAKADKALYKAKIEGRDRVVLAE